MEAGAVTSDPRRSQSQTSTPVSQQCRLVILYPYPLYPFPLCPPEECQTQGLQLIASGWAHLLETHIEPQQTRKPSSSIAVKAQQRMLSAMRPEPSSPLFTPSSPLSPALNSAPRRSAKNKNSPRPANLVRTSHTTQQTTSMISEEISKQSLQTSASRRFSDAQMALQNFQRELIASATRPSRTVSTAVIYKPLSPKLLPLGSPGPVTPLMLEERGEHLVADAVGRGIGLDERAESVFVERLMHEEQRRQNSPAERASAFSPAGGS